MWNVVGVAVLAVTAYLAASVALVGFGLDSLIEIAACIVVLWKLSGSGHARQRFALRLIGAVFVAMVVYLLIQSGLALILYHHAKASTASVTWTAVTAAATFALVAAKIRTGRALGNPVLKTEGRVTFIDGLLAVAVLLGLPLNGLFGWWWAGPVAGFVIVFYAIREANTIFTELKTATS